MKQGYEIIPTKNEGFNFIKVLNYIPLNTVGMFGYFSYESAYDGGKYTTAIFKIKYK